MIRVVRPLFLGAVMVSLAVFYGVKYHREEKQRQHRQFFDARVADFDALEKRNHVLDLAIG